MTNGFVRIILFGLLMSFKSWAVVGLVDPGLKGQETLIKKELSASEDLSVKKAAVVEDKSGEAPSADAQMGITATPRVELSKSEANLGCATWKLKASMAKLSGKIAQCAQVIADHPNCPGITCGPSNPPESTPVSNADKVEAAKATAVNTAAEDEDSHKTLRYSDTRPAGSTPSISGATRAVTNTRRTRSPSRQPNSGRSNSQVSTEDDSQDSSENDNSDVSAPVRRVARSSSNATDDSASEESNTGDQSPDYTSPNRKQSQNSSRSTDYQPGDDGSKPSRSNGNNNSADGTGNNGGYIDQQSGNHDDIVALQKCDTLRSAAETACKLTDDTETATNSDSLTNTCKQSTDKGIKSTNSKADASSNCTQKFTQCAENCQDAYDTYSDSPDVEYFRTNRNACLALSENSSKMIDAGHSSYQLASSGLNCQENASESPQSAAGSQAGAKDQAQARNPIAEALCAANPTAPGCSTTSANAEPGALQAEGGIKDAAQSQGTADVADTAFDKRISSIFGDPATASAPGAKNGAVANNSGGAIPNAGSNAANANDSGGGNALMRGLKAVGQAITDIELGYLGGGYAMLIRGENPWADEPISEAEVNRAIAALGGAPKKIDPDLRRYLPGGDLAMNGTFLLPYETEFHGKWTNIFEKIHDRYTLKCKLAVLLDCPEKDR